MLRIIFIFVGLLFFVPYVARAEIVVNEIMYAPEGTQSGREWVEIKNDRNDAVNFSEKIGTAYRWRLIKGDNDSPISPFNESSTILHPGEFAIVASNGDKFLQDYPNFSGLLLKSGFGSLNDSGDTISVKDRTNDSVSGTVDYVPYAEQAKKNGNSLQLSSGSWLAATPTPGEENETESAPGSSNDEASEEDGSVTDTDNSEQARDADVDPVVNDPEETRNAEDDEEGDEVSRPKPKADTSAPKAKIVSKTSAFTGQPVEMEAEISKSGKNVSLGRVYWNFGDGGSLEQRNNFETFSHTYDYPGDYIVSLEYYQNSFSKTPEVVAKMTIKVATTNVIISKVGDAKDFFIELSNNATSEIDVSGWFFGATGKIFVLPKNSVIAGKKHLTISSKITGFVYGDQESLKLFSSTGELIFDYLASSVTPLPNPPRRGGSAPYSTPPVAPPKAPAETPAFLSSSDEPQADAGVEIPVENLEASVVGGEITNDKTNNSYMLMILSLAFIGTSAGAVYFIRKRDAIKSDNPADNFTILED